MAELTRLGARSVPVIAKGEKFAFAQVISDVVQFLELADDTAPALPPGELAKRYDHILETAIRLIRQMPNDCLERELPNRPRSWRVLMHHVFQIPMAFLDMEETGKTLAFENLVAPPPPHLRTSADIAAFGEVVREQFKEWWSGTGDRDFDTNVSTYFGQTSRHEMLERTVWHSAQHVRQVASLLEQAGVIPDQPLAASDIRGLPLTETIWDEG